VLPILLLGSTASAVGEDPISDELPPPEPRITRAELEHHVRFLAADELRGRRTGSPEAVRAARYLARALERAGLEPAGDDGTFLQAVPLVSYVHEAEPTLVVTTKDGEQLEPQFGEGFSLSVRDAPRSTGPLPIRIVRELADLPEEEHAGEALAFDAERADRREWLRARGLHESAAGWGLYVMGTTRRGRNTGLPRHRLQRITGDGEDRADILVLYGELWERLKAGEFATLELSYRTRRREVTDYNVIGRIRGVGELARETVVFSAHYDHIGVRDAGDVHDGDADGASEAEDLIFNGADDDASGTAAVLELAEAFAAGDQPARTLIFLLATGEEQGLLGTWHYLDHPAEPLEVTVANLNFEMIGRPDELVGGAGKLWLTGFERTTLGPAFQERGLDIVPDQRPGQRFFQRSDNYAFVERGIVGQTLSTYNLHTDYHQVSDEADTLDYAHMEACVRSALLASRMLADGSLTPEWLPGGRPEPR